MLTCIGTYTALQCLEKFFAEKKKLIGQVKYASNACGTNACGTNACVFLCLKLAHEDLSKDCLSRSSNVAQLAEDIIEKFPRVINSYRDILKNITTF